MKKYKLFAFTFIIAILSMVTVNAREMTASELGQAAIDQYSDSEKDVGYIYVIGEYAFTSQYDIKTEDIMLAANSIGIEKDAVKFNEDGNTLTDDYKKMVINTIRAQVGDDFTIEGWEVVDAAVGTKDTTTEKFNIRFIDYVFQQETSEANIKFDKTTEEAYKSYLTSDFGINDPSKLYDGELTYEDGKLTGQMLRYNITKGFAEKDKTGYYLPFVIEVPGLTENTTVTIKEDLTVTAKKENFDIKESSEGKNPGIVVLWSIPGETDERVITITVDLDGPDNKEYGPTTYTIDYTGLRLQQDSEGTIDSENLPEADVTYISSTYGYTKTKEDTYKLEKEENSNKYKLTGNIVYQTIKDNIFPDDEETGYYFLFNVGVDKEYYSKATVTFPGNKDTKTSPITDETGVTILFSLKNENNTTPIKITIDLDGDGKEYYPTTYEIDLTGVKFQKSSEFTVASLTEDEFEDEEGWHDTDNGYKVTVAKDESDKTLYHVSGLLPIVDDDSWSDEKFDHNAYLYYLGLLLQLTDKDISSGDDINVKFFHNDTEDSNFIKATGEDFASQKELYILKALSATDETKKFTITVDLDGTGENYAPYTVTIDWSGLVLQAESNGDFGNYEVLNTSELGANTPEKTELTSYGYKEIGAQDVQLHMDNESQPDRDDPVKAGLEGVIREQTLGAGAGFKDEEGYYVPIKVSYPGTGIEGMDKWSKSWTIILNTDDNETREYKPTSAEYAQGWVMVLFKVYRDGKTVDGSGNQKEITYQIDFDGLEKHEFIPQEYSIKYDELTFESENEITYKYTGKDGKATEETVTVYENETVDLKDMSEVNDDYRTFEKWTKEDNQDLDAEFKTTQDQDVTLNAHWTIDVDKYITDAILVVNQKANVQNNFHIVKESDTFKVEILNKETQLSDITDTALAGAIAHALSFGDVESVKVKLGELEEEFKVSDNNYDESTIKTKVTEDLKTFFTTKVVESDEKTLDDLYTKWQADENGLQLIVTPKENVAKIKDQDSTLTYKITISESSTHMVVQANSEDKYQVVNNKVLGTITKQDENDKFMIPVIITNDGFNESSKITVTDPNNKETEYTYSESGIMTTSVSVPNKSVTLNLEALKESEITAEGGKKAYTISIDLDGSEDGEADETYTIDYTEAETIEEKINKAAQNTQATTSLTTIKDNKIKNGIEKFTYKFDTTNGYTYYKSTDNENEEQYSFKIKYLYSDHQTDSSIVVSKKQGDQAVCDEKNNCKPEINGWLYDFTLNNVSKVTHELKLLQDITKKENETIRAISKVAQTDGAHTYTVTITKDALNEWINGTYETGKMEEKTDAEKTAEPAEGDSITLTVELDEKEEYVKSIKTTSDFTVKVNNVDISGNKMDIQYSDFNNTNIDEPIKFLGQDEENPTTKEKLMEFYQKGIEYWEKHTGSQKYQG